jgi:hypothetical protein
MASFAIGKHARAIGLLALLAVGVPCGLIWKARHAAYVRESVLNYALVYSMPIGWVERHHSAQALFLYLDPKTKVTMRGAHSQIISDENPTPDMNRDSLADDIAFVTKDHLGWKVQMLDVVACPGGSYRLIRRETVDRIIVSAVAVHGNTTILITLAGIGAAKDSLDSEIPAFRKFLADTSLQQRNMDL